MWTIFTRFVFAILGMWIIGGSFFVIYLLFCVFKCLREERKDRDDTD